MAVPGLDAEIDQAIKIFGNRRPRMIWQRPIVAESLSQHLVV
jgi:hypothetical protein